MPVFSPLLSTEVKNLLTAKYDKIKTQTRGFNLVGGLCKELTFTLVDESQKFDIEHFISQVAPIRTRFKINFAVSYILNEEAGPRYFHQSHNNSRILPLAFVVRGPEDLTRFKDEFSRGNWLDLNTHVIMRPNSKSTPVCLASITFFIYLVDGIFQFVGKPPNEMPPYFSATMSLYTLAANVKSEKYTDNLCFFRNIICGHERAKNPKKFQTKMIISCCC